MNQGGIAGRLVDFVLALFGKLPGALLVTNVGANALFGAISGSASAAVSYTHLLAESYGARGIRVTSEKEIAEALRMAREPSRVPTVIEFMIDREENVFPIVPPGNALDHMILEREEK